MPTVYRSPFRPTPALAKGAHIFFSLNKKLGLGNEGYKLTITPLRVVAEAATPNGLFYAAQTLRQLLPASQLTTVALPACAIADKLRFGYRGLMLDVGRHFMPVPFVKKFIDLMAMHKQNTFHWHLTALAARRRLGVAYRNQKIPEINPGRQQTRRIHCGSV